MTAYPDGTRIMLWDSDECATMASVRHVNRARPAAGGGNAARTAAGWLCLAATPAFALMALLTVVSGGGAADMMCMGAPHALPLTGMEPMYLLMSVFHAGPWLKLIAGRRQGSEARS